MGVVVDECDHGLTARLCSVCRAETGHNARWGRRRAREAEVAAEAAGRPIGVVTANYGGVCANGEDCQIAVGDWIVWSNGAGGWTCWNHRD